MIEEIVKKHIIFEFVYKKIMVLGVKMAEIFEKNTKKTFEKTRKMPLESIKIKIFKIGLRSDLSWPKVGLKPKFHEPGTFGGFGKCKQTHRQTDIQDSCFISIYILLYSLSILSMMTCDNNNN